MESAEINTHFTCDNCGYIIFSLKTDGSGKSQINTFEPVALHLIDKSKGELRAYCRRCGESKDFVYQTGGESPSAPLPPNKPLPLSEHPRIKFTEATNHTRPDLEKEFSRREQRQNSAFRHADFRRVVDAFIQSVRRMDWLVLYPLVIGHTNAHDQLMQCIATFNHTGNPEAQGLDADDVEIINRRARGLSFARVNVEIAKELDQIARKIDESDAATDGALRHAAEAIFSAQIVQAWSAFETLAGDLWESTINLYPKGLAALSGKESRIERKANKGTAKREKLESEVDQDQPGQDVQNKQIDLNRAGQLAGGTYNLGAVMGTLLKGRFKFSTLTGIRRAYSAAFDKRSGAIDLVLSTESLDACMLLRNLIVHKGGKADQVYIDDSNGIPIAPKLAMKEQFAPDGIISRNLIDPVIICGKNLIIAVDDWITDARDRDEQKRNDAIP